MQIQIKSAKEALINEVYFDKNTKKVSYKDKNGIITIVNQDAPSIEASIVPYDNTSSGLSSTEVQSAIDELAATSGSGYTETVVDISAAQFLSGFQLGVDLMPSPGVGKYYDWYAIIEKNGDGSINIGTDKMFIGTSDFMEGATINAISINNVEDPLKCLVRPNPLNTSNSNLNFDALGLGIKIASWGGVVPNAATCSFKVRIFTRVITLGE